MEWLDAISESNAICSAILAVIHPKLYDAGLQAIQRLRGTLEVERQDVLRHWASVFSGVAIISNHRSPKHRDSGSRFNWYDLLVTLETYRGLNLNLPGLGISLEYGFGTVVGILGMALDHKVPEVEGDRVCNAYFMKDKVHEWAEVSGKDWMDIKHYEQDKNHRM